MHIPPKELHEHCANAWNAHHFKSIERGNPIGLGGLVRPSLVAKAFASKGKQIRTHQYHQHEGSKPSPVAIACGGKQLFREQVDQLSYRDAATWLGVIHESIENTVHKRRKRLHLYKYFDDHPKIKYLEM